MSDPTTEELIEKLIPDEDRDYGDDNREGVTEKIVAGEYVIREHPEGGQPIFTTSGGRIVKGSGKVGYKGRQGAAQQLNILLNKFIAEDGGGELAIATLLEALEGGKDDEGKDKVPWKTRMDAVELTFLRVLGVPERNATPNESAALLALLELAQLGKLNERRSIPEAPQYTTVEMVPE